MGKSENGVRLILGADSCFLPHAFVHFRPRSFCGKAATTKTGASAARLIAAFAAATLALT